MPRGERGLLRASSHRGRHCPPDLLGTHRCRGSTPLPRALQLGGDTSGNNASCFVRAPAPSHLLARPVPELRATVAQETWGDEVLGTNPTPAQPRAPGAFTPNCLQVQPSRERPCPLLALIPSPLIVWLHFLQEVTKGKIHAVAFLCSWL